MLRYVQRCSETGLAGFKHTRCKQDITSGTFLCCTPFVWTPQILAYYGTSIVAHHNRSLFVSGRILEPAMLFTSTVATILEG